MSSHVGSLRSSLAVTIHGSTYKTTQQLYDQTKSGGYMAGFKLTYSTMFNPPEELHKGFDKAV
ncbi:MAG TPA: hypothetical protein VHO49_15770, partial [Anaerolineales bacterium]|nr:hypothetical protein [Anaerolineales bacterium]